MSDIKISLKCRNLAPLFNLDWEDNVWAMKLGIFANNGSGKTFLSRMFRYLEKTGETIISTESNHIISFGKENTVFSFSVKGNNVQIPENVDLEIKKNIDFVPPKTEYIYHVFNQDFVDDNIKALDYKHDNVQGFILGKAQIDLSSDEEKLSKIEARGKELNSTIKKSIDKFVRDKVNVIRDIKRLNEYKRLNVDEILSGSQNKVEGIDDFDKYIADWNRLKSIPDDISLLDTMLVFQYDKRVFEEIKDTLSKEYSLSTFAETFKELIKRKQTFVTEGVKLFDRGLNKCPFCEQSLNSSAQELIDNYTKFLKDEEAEIQRKLAHYDEVISMTITKLKGYNSDCLIKCKLYSEYKLKYLQGVKDEINNVDTEQIVQLLNQISDEVRVKQEAIDKSIDVTHSVSSLEQEMGKIESLIIANNNAIRKINGILSNQSEESKRVRNNICKSAYNKIISDHSERLGELNKCRDEYSALKTSIEQKKSLHKIDKKKLVIETIKKVLNSFFSGTYHLDENTLRLTFKEQQIEGKSVKYVLSEGEKNIVAFAYYLGDVHLKMNSLEDYRRLFFVIDDPISSMDYTYVYTLCGIIRELKNVFDGKIVYERFIILTHNTEFMRILFSNKIVSHSYILRNSTISSFNINFTVPYISHLMDIYAIANEKKDISHTTANSIRHIIETLTKFYYIDISEESIKQYIQDHFDNNKTTYTQIQDLSHGGWRSEQLPFTKEEYVEICRCVVKDIENIFPKQIEYCKKNM